MHLLNFDFNQVTCTRKHFDKSKRICKPNNILLHLKLYLIILEKSGHSFLAKPYKSQTGFIKDEHDEAENSASYFHIIFANNLILFYDILFLFAATGQAPAFK